MATDWSGGDSFVAMVQSTNLRNFDDPSRLDWLNWTTDGRIFAQRQMSPRSLVVFEVRFQDSAQTGFIQDDHMIQALATDRADQPLDVGVLPRGLRCRENFPNAQPVCRFTKSLSIAPIPIPQQAT